ncbi:MAG TPA: ankyrin repeat domain-containing protein [Gemmatimonadaceae bacterium]|jgi:ankyrin repeat protein
MATPLPPRPSLEWLRKAAKDRLVQLRARDTSAKLADAQLAVARAHGFPSWRQLKAHIDRIASHPGPPIPEATVAGFLRDVGTGRIDAVRAAIAACPGVVNAVGPHPFWGGRPQALHVAIEAKRRDVFDLLLQHGADVNGSNDQYDHWSPLMLAIDRERSDMVEALRARGARVGLVEALMMGDDARVEELLRSGGLPDRSPNGGSILAFARTPYAIDRLVALGASADTKDRWGSTPIDAMSRRGARGGALVRRLMGHGVSARPQEFARVGDRETLERLIEQDPAITKIDTVMMGAVEFGHHDLVRWLLDRGANVNARSDAASRHTALHSAAWNGDVEMVRLLLAAGADPALRDDEHNGTALGWAEASIEITHNPRCAEVAALLRAGAS